MVRPVPFLSLVAAATLLAAPAFAVPVTVTLTTADGLGADSYVRGGNTVDPNTGMSYRDSNYGSADIAVEKFTPAGQGSGSTTIAYDNNFTRFAWFRFDLGSIAGPVTGATLTLGVRATENALPTDIVINTIAEGHAQDAAPTAGGWEESTLTMVNSSLLDDPVALLDPLLSAGQTLPGAQVPSLTDLFTLSHANLVARLNADTNGLVTFIIVGAPSQSPRGANFWTKENLEGGFVPTLKITYEVNTTLPETAALGLFGLGLAGLGLAARRRR